MEMAIIFVLCSLAVGAAEDEVVLEADRPFLSVPRFGEAVLECCFTITTTSKAEPHSWVKSFIAGNKTVDQHPVLNASNKTEKNNDRVCGILSLKSVKLNDSGLYQCWLNDHKFYTHGTYLQVYKPLKKTINLSESTKNKILTAEGILLLLCVLLPSVTLLFKSKRVNELEKKKVTKEEENIYQGLNLDDCCTTYDQIERSQAHGPYQDVCNIIEEEEDIQLEKP